MPIMPKRQNQTDMPQTAGSILVSFLLTCVFGAAGILLLLELTDTVPLFIRIVSGQRYIFNAARNAAAIILALTWIALFFLLWHKLERAGGYKQRLIKTAKWSGIAVAAYIVALAGHVLIVEYLFNLI